MTMKNIPLRIRAMMKSYKISAPKLAERAGLPLPSVKSILHGQSNSPRKKTLQALAKAFNCQISEFEKSPDAPVEVRWNLYGHTLPSIGSILEEELVKNAIQVIREIAENKDLDLTGRDDLRQIYVDKLVNFAIDEGAKLNKTPAIDRVYANWLVGRE